VRSTTCLIFNGFPLPVRQAAAREEEVCRQTAALKKTEYTLGAVKGELERGLQAREAAKTRIAGADLCVWAV
jgi:hypothetical protein